MPQKGQLPFLSSSFHFSNVRFLKDSWRSNVTSNKVRTYQRLDNSYIALTGDHKFTTSLCNGKFWYQTKFDQIAKCCSNLTWQAEHVSIEVPAQKNSKRDEASRPRSRTSENLAKRQLTVETATV